MKVDAKLLNQSLDIINDILDDIAFFQVNGDDAPDTKDSIVDRIQTKLSRVANYLDRLYPEDYDGFGPTRELDFEEGPAQGSFDFDEEEEER